MKPWLGRYNRRHGHTPGQMNSLEQRYSGMLAIMKAGGHILNFKFEAVKLKLADNTFYTPDFFVVYADHFEFVETKGFLQDDAAVKFKVAREQFPFFVFKMLQYKGGEWKEILTEGK